MWHLAKLSCPAFNRKKAHMLGYLATFMLRRKFKQEPDSFASFMMLCAKLYEDTDEDRHKNFPICEDEFDSILEAELYNPPITQASTLESEYK